MLDSILGSRAGRLLQRLSLIGDDPADSDRVRAQKVALVLAAVTIVVLSCAWVGTYLVLGLPLAALIPLTYQLVTIASLVVFSRFKDVRLLRTSQIVLMLTLPFLLQWTLGGYAASSAVSLWATISVFGALFFYTAAAAVPWFLAFVGLTVVSGLIDPIISANPAPIPYPVQVTFFVLTIGGVTLTTYLMLQYSIRARDAAHGRSEELLLNVLPRSVADRLRREPGVIAERFDDVTVLFADIVDFTPFAERTRPERIVGLLDEVFSSFDALTQRHGLEKIKTIGDAYMVAGGVPEPRADHVEAVAAMAVEMLADLAAVCSRVGTRIDIRIGIDTGPVVAGVIGRHRFIYDLWGDTVNTASRMESHGVPGRIQVTQRTRDRLAGRYRFEERGSIDLKGKGPTPAYLLVAAAVSAASVAGSAEEPQRAMGGHDDVGHVDDLADPKVDRHARQQVGLDG
jgi:class 3 adenylate cyclase